MKIFVWERASGTTGNYHSEAGVVLIANTLEEARIAAKSHEGINVESEVFTSPPNFTSDLELLVENVWIFPDAGCC